MTVSQPPFNASNSIIVRLKIDNKVGMLASVNRLISEMGGVVGAIDLVGPEDGVLVRDISIFTNNPEHSDKIVESIKKTSGVEFINFSDRTFLVHLGGKISIRNRIPVKTRDDLSMAYTPGVARICMEIYQNPEDAYKLTTKGNTVAVVTDGTAVLGLGNIGPKAAMPVMEGKAMLFKEFADIDAWPICLDTTDTEEIIRIVKAISPGFGGINLEDMALTILIISSVSVVSRQIGHASISANSLKSIALPSITGIAALGPIFPSPSTAVPSVTTATVFPLVVSLYASSGF
jgi:malate dehydrogenase (oxaloacetate-decarboxylating)